jgi:putative ABC transport system ATP-binding protein
MGTLRLKHVSKEYVTEGSSVPALHDVNVEFQAGEHVAFVGRGGRGKSTLLSLAGAMDFPTAGIAWLGGVSTSTLNDPALMRVRHEKAGFIFQSRRNQAPRPKGL